MSLPPSQQPPSIDDQIKLEQMELASAPKVPIEQYQSGQAQRCGFCGRAAKNLVPVHDLGPNGSIVNERYKGVECCGERHL